LLHGPATLWLFLRHGFARVTETLSPRRFNELHYLGKVREQY